MIKSLCSSVVLFAVSLVSGCERIKALLASPVQLLLDFLCRISPELIKLPPSSFGSQALVLPMQKAFPLTARFLLELWADEDFFLTNNPSCFHVFCP